MTAPHTAVSTDSAARGGADGGAWGPPPTIEVGMTMGTSLSTSWLAEQEAWEQHRTRGGTWVLVQYMLSECSPPPGLSPYL